jgi:hypothetical protein
LLTLGNSASKAAIYPLYDNRSLELREHAGHLQEGATRSRSAIDLLLVEVNADPLLAQLVHEFDQMANAAANAIDGLANHDVELALGRIFGEPGEARSLLTALGAADAVIDVGIDDDPAALLGDALKVNALVLDGLPRRGDPQVQPDPLSFAHDDHPFVVW